ISVVARRTPPSSAVTTSVAPGTGRVAVSTMTPEIEPLCWLAPTPSAATKRLAIIWLLLTKASSTPMIRLGRARVSVRFAARTIIRPCRTGGRMLELETLYYGVPASIYQIGGDAFLVHHRSLPTGTTEIDALAVRLLAACTGLKTLA